MPSESELPEALVPLAYRNATEVRAGAGFRSQLARLVMALEQLLSTIPTPIIEKSKPQPTSGKPATSEKQTITVSPSSTETPGTISKSQKKKSAAPVNYIPLWFSPVAAVSLIFLTFIALLYLSSYRIEPVLQRIHQLERTPISFNPEGGVEGINQNDREKVSRHQKLVRSIFSILGFILIAGLIWFAGPFISIGDTHPFAPVVIRFITIPTFFIIMLGLWQRVWVLKMIHTAHRFLNNLASVIFKRLISLSPVHIVSILIAIVGVTLLVESFRQNTSLVTEYESYLAEYRLLQQRSRKIAVGENLDYVTNIVDRLDILRKLAGDELVNNHTFVAGLDFIQGNRLRELSLQAYKRSLINLFQPLLMSQLERQIRSGSGNANYLEEALKVNRMMAEPGERDVEFISHWMELSWQNDYPGEVLLSSRLKTHLEELLILGRPVSTDSQLIEQPNVN